MNFRFTTRQLFLAVALIAAGFACLRPVLTLDSTNVTLLDAYLFIGGWFGSGILFGAALGGLFLNTWPAGACAGLLVQFILILVITGAYWAMKVPINAVAYISLDAPTVAAHEVKHRGVTRWRFWCRHCRQWHYHGPGEGHREAHCTERDSPFTRPDSIRRWRGD